MKRSRRSQRLVALAVFGALLLNYPLLSLFNRVQTVFGHPMLYAYLFVVWAALIGLLALIAERG